MRNDCRATLQACVPEQYINHRREVSFPRNRNDLAYLPRYLVTLACLSNSINVVSYLTNHIRREWAFWDPSDSDRLLTDYCTGCSLSFVGIYRGSRDRNLPRCADFLGNGTSDDAPSSSFLQSTRASPRALYPRRQSVHAKCILYERRARESVLLSLPRCLLSCLIPANVQRAYVLVKQLIIDNAL